MLQPACVCRRVQSSNRERPNMAPTPPSTSRDKVRTVAPKLIDLTEKVVFGDVWERPGLSKRDRSLITVATLVALNRTRAARRASRARAQQWRHQGRDRRAHYPSRVLCGLAVRHVGRAVPPRTCSRRRSKKRNAWRRICKLDSSVWAPWAPTWRPISRPQATSWWCTTCARRLRTGIWRPARAGRTAPRLSARRQTSSSPRCQGRPRWKPWRSVKVACSKA